MTLLKTSQVIGEIRSRVANVVVGQDVVVERILIALLTGGHLLLEGVPGLAKTLLVNTVARTIGMGFGRVQFTIDMLPSDVLGSEILDQATHEFRIHKGPVFTNLLLADEINRARPEGARLPAGGDAGTEGHAGQQDVHAAGSVPGDRHAEPDRAGGHLRASRGPARSVHALPSAALPHGRRREGHLPPAAQHGFCGSGRKVAVPCRRARST